MNRRSVQVLNGIASVVALGLLLVGTPVLLATLVGWPLPTELPARDTVEVALQSGISGQVLVKALAVVAWLVWAQIAVSIVSEVIAALRGRSARPMPVAPGFQAIAGRLVASIAIMVATLTPAVSAASPRAAPTPVLASLSVTHAASDPSVTSIVPDSAPEPTVSPSAAAAPAPTITVERHDSYWAIAERTLGDGLRWREIRDRNIGRLMNTGDVIHAGSDLLYPGWVIDLPTDAVVPTTVDTSTGSAGAGEVVVEPGDSFWSIAEAQLAATNAEPPSPAEVLPYMQDLMATNEPRLADPDIPGLIFAGQVLEVPATPGAPAGGPVQPSDEPSESEPSPAETSPPAPGPDPAPASAGPPTVNPAPPPTTVEPEDAAAIPATSNPTTRPPVSNATAPTETPPSEEDDPTILVGGLASAALAAGATLAIRRRRRREMRRPTPRRPAPPSTEAQAVHHQLVAHADLDGVDALRATLAHLARSLNDRGTGVRPRIVQQDNHRVEVLLDQPADPPSPWTDIGEGLVWTTTAETMHTGSEEPVCVAPLLVTLGQPDEGGQIYLDLEAERVVSLEGDGPTATATARAMVAELALTPLAETLEVIVIGDLTTPDLDTVEHVTVVNSWDEVADDLSEWIVHSRAAIAANGWANSFVGRGSDPHHDALVPIVAVADGPPPDELLAQIRGEEWAAVAVVAIGEMSGATLIKCGPDSISIPEIGLECTPHPMEAETLDAIVELVGEPIDLREADVDEQLALISPETLDTAEPEGLDEPYAEPEHEVLVRLLGDIRVESSAPLAAKHTAVVAYVALNRTVSADKLEAVVWSTPTSGSRRKRLANTISECRTTLGRHHFPPARDGWYRAGPGVITDVDLFERRVRRAAMQEPGEAADTLLLALDLVTGPPFTYRTADRSTFTWVDVENWASTWEAKIALTAQRCVDLLVEISRTDDAVAAARHALRVSPLNSQLTESLMRALAAQGEWVAVESVFEEHANALATLDLDQPDESTLLLYDELREARARRSCRPSEA